MDIARYLDAAILKPDMTHAEVEAAIRECIALRAMTVCVRGCDIDFALEMTKGTETLVSCVLDFPYGYSGIETKRAAARDYAGKGVYEIDMVMNYAAARSGDWETVEKEIRAVVEEAHAKNVGVKVIFETSQLNVEQIYKGTEVCIAAGADFVKTSTGFNGEGATVESVKAMVDAAKGRIKVKPSGGIRNFETAKMYVEMGADRLGVGFGSCKPICEGVGSSKEAY